MINIITAETFGEDLFNEFLEDCFDSRSFEEHYKGSTFTCRNVYYINYVDINGDGTYKYPELLGYWESNMFLWDSVYGIIEPITTLYRVEKKEMMAKKVEYQRVTT